MKQDCDSYSINFDDLLRYQIIPDIIKVNKINPEELNYIIINI